MIIVLYEKYMYRLITDKEDRHTISTFIKAMENYRKRYITSNSFNNLSNTEVEILSCVALQESLYTAKEIVAFLNISKGLVSQRIDFLVSEGYLIKEINDKDKRSHFLSLGEKSMPFAEDLINIGDNFYQMLRRGVSDKDVLIFDKVLQIMSNNIEDEMKIRR